MTTNTPTTLIRQKRLDRGLSLRTVADATGIPRSVLQRIETGTRIAQRDHARALYRYYDYEIGLGDIYDPAFDYEVAGAKPQEGT